MLDEGVTFSLGKWKVNGYSAASRVTWLVIPQLNSIFDIGWCIEQMRYIPRVFLSHLHQDHCIALPTWISWRQKFLPQIPQVYVPKKSVQQTKDFVHSICVAEDYDMKYEIIGLDEGDRVEIEKNRVVEAFYTTHFLPTIGFMVKEKRKKLRSDFQGKTSDEIRAAIRSGEDVHEHNEVPIFCYTSDTDTDLFARRPDILDAEILITECSHVENYLQYDPSITPPDNRVTHNTLAQLAPILENFTGKTLAFCHLPRKFEMCNLHMYILPRLPQQQRDKLCLVPYRSRYPRHIYAEATSPPENEITTTPLQFCENTSEEIVYHWQDNFITHNSALQLYEDAYYHFLQDNHQVCDWLVKKAADIFEKNPTDTKDRTHYNVEASSVQCIAIRRVLLRLGKWFNGKRLIAIGDVRSEGYVLSSHVVPFHESQHIVSAPQQKDILTNSVANFWHSNRYTPPPANQ
ncbi:MBL fold metallo-hydrolase [Candidatus Uabimicrobium amorphum]|uniref:MBL fold metallo-hydrolase n=1 Tax=Uabimicrobium amorphum TaxID=2596890 RepID=A0A5S9IUN2_UABAM|nr:hypothetical protein [Candidatus Uabimicrobium amorphum]BBM88224.1 MBL fold metallo-hydrolase [Candidatus Uabimicrobium amorphum]